MDAQALITLKKAVAALERTLEDFETLGEAEDSQPLRKGAEKLVEALVLLYGLDPALMTAGNQARIAAAIAKSKVRPERNTFNTGF
jgi:hypothetical protein